MIGPDLLKEMEKIVKKIKQNLNSTWGKQNIYANFEKDTCWEGVPGVNFDKLCNIFL